MDIWAKIKAEYISGGGSCRVIAEKYAKKHPGDGITRSKVERRCKIEGWTKTRDEKRQKAAEKLADRMADREAARAEQLCDVAVKLLGKVDELGDLVGTARDLRDLTAAVKDIREILSIKGARDIREQEARIDKLLHDAKDKQEQAPEIRFVLTPELAELAK